MTPEKEIAALRKQLEALKEIDYRIIEKNGKITIHDGKYVVVPCFSRDLAERICDSMKSTILSHAGVIEKILDDFNSKVVEYQTDLFGTGDEDDNTDK
jgi:uncharacterized membrane protein YcaP (DUF421 family)